jgi:MtN3 and saliva related transmembrane protein
VKTALGLVAGLFTTVAWIPQIVHSWQRKSAAGISWGYLATIGTGVLLWLVYGIWTVSIPLIAANAVSDALVLLLVGMKAQLFWHDVAPAVGAVIGSSPDLEAQHD